MIPAKIKKLLTDFHGPKTFQAINFGCRVNSAETNQLSQILVDNGFIPDSNAPGIILINTCAITAKGEYESLSKIRTAAANHPNSLILATGCADLKKINKIKNIFILPNTEKEQLSDDLECAYSTKIGDKFTNSQKFILKIQSGCNQFCSYCAVPFRRGILWSLPPKIAVSTINKAISQGYQELIITGINLNLYHPSVSSLLETILKETSISKISFGSLPLNSVDEKLLEIYQNPIHQNRLNSFLHIPLQSGSDHVLKLMNRPYSQKQILDTFEALHQSSPRLSFGTDIIVGFPGETEEDFNATYNICQKIGFQKIHTFRYSIRPGTKAEKIYNNEKKIPQKIINMRSRLIRMLNQNLSY